MSTDNIRRTPRGAPYVVHDAVDFDPHDPEDVARAERENTAAVLEAIAHLEALKRNKS